nr:DUF1983 domain-containing protein [Escherichia coli]
MEAVGRASDDAEGYLDFFKGKITESHLGKELLEKVDLTEDNASRLDEFSKEWKDANDKWNAMWGVKIEQTKDGKHYVAGIGLSMEDTEEGKLSQFLVAANRIAFIDPANGNETPMFVAQGNQIFMNDVFLKRLAPLQDAADLEIATEEEISLLEAWKKYRVLLNRVDTSTAQDIEWPALP